MSACGSAGLHLYNYGCTVSIPYFTENWRPTSFVDKIIYNRKGGMHTLCLLDIKTKEPDFEEMVKGRVKYLPPRFMTVNEGIRQLLEAVEETCGGKEGGDQEGVYDGSTLAIGLARLGQADQIIAAGTLEELEKADFGKPLHSIIICGNVHETEIEALKPYFLEGNKYYERED